MFVTHSMDNLSSFIDEISEIATIITQSSDILILSVKLGAYVAKKVIVAGKYFVAWIKKKIDNRKKKKMIIMEQESVSGQLIKQDPSKVFSYVEDPELLACIEQVMKEDKKSQKEMIKIQKKLEETEKIAMEHLRANKEIKNLYEQNQVLIEKILGESEKQKETQKRDEILNLEKQMKLDISESNTKDTIKNKKKIIENLNSKSRILQLESKSLKLKDERYKLEEELRELERLESMKKNEKDQYKKKEYTYN